MTVKRLTALSSGCSNGLLGCRHFFFLSFAVILFSTPLAFAQAIEKPLLAWLPFLTADLQLLQPDLRCPQNKIVNMQLRKEGNHLDADIAAVDWDLDCQAGRAESAARQAFPSLSESKDKIDAQIKALLAQLSALPETNLQIQALKLYSSVSAKEIILNATLTKTAHSVVLHLWAEQVDLNLQINLLNQKLTLNARLAVQELEKFYPLPEKLKKHLPRQLTIAYQSDLQHWQAGSFTLNAQGQLPALAEHFDLSAAGSVALLTEQINVKKMLLDLKNVSHNISAQQDWRTAHIQLKLSKTAVINLSPLTVTSLPLQLRVARSVLSTKSTEKNSQRIVVHKQKLPALFAAVKAQGRLDNMAASWNISLLNQDLKGELWYAHRKLKVDMANTPLAAQKLVTALRHYLPDLQLLEIQTGDINLQLSADYDLNKKAASLKGIINGKDIAGRHDKVLFDGVTVTGEIDYRFEKQQLIIKRDKQQLKIANLFIGIPVQALQVDAQLNGLNIIIDRFKARLLGGRVDFADLKLTAPSQTAIKLSALSLSEVIKYSAYPEIDAQGIIDGLLPLSLTEQGPAIKNGVISARYPGYIKVPENTVVKAMGKDNPAFAFTMQVLTNLQFDSLQGVLDYAANGETSLNVEMKGINPNLSRARAVIFNYSHNENILQLLKSLRFNERLNKQIEERY